MPATDQDAEKAGGDLRELVRLVQDETVRARQELAEPLVLERQIGTEQVVIDHHQVRRLGLATGLHQVTVLPLRAGLAETVVAGGGHRGPHLGILGDGQFPDIPPAGSLRPVLDLAQLVAHLQGLPGGVVEGQLEPVATEIVGTPLE